MNLLSSKFKKVQEEIRLASETDANGTTEENTSDVGDFSFFEPDVIGTKISRSNRMLTTSAMGIGFGTVLAIAGVFWFIQSNGNHFSKNPYVYFEVRAVDGEGHPVSGASVYVAKKQSGVTDTFGEWRRYMKARLGSHLAVKIVKKQGETFLSATKNIVIPISTPKSGDIEVVKSIQLFDQQKKDPARFISQKKPMPKAIEMVAEKEDSAPIAEVVITEAQTASSDPEEVAIGMTGGVDVDPIESDGFGFDRVAIDVRQKYFSATNNLGRQRYNFLKNNIANGLKRKFIKMGVAIDSSSPWRITLSHLTVGNGESLIKVDSRLKHLEKVHRSSFLKKYMTSADTTANFLVKALKFHVTRPYAVMRDGNSWYALQPTKAIGFWALSPRDRLTDRGNKPIRLGSVSQIGSMKRIKLLASGNPCKNNLDSQGRCSMSRLTFKHNSPNAGWRRQKATLSGLAARGTQVYFSGYEARLVAGNTWEYWGQPNGRSNVTVVQKGRVKFRRQLATPALAKASIAVARSRVASR